MSDVRAWIEERQAIQAAATQGEWKWAGESDEPWPSGENSLLAGDEIVLFGWGYDASGIEASPEDETSIVDAHNMFPRALDALNAVLELHKTMPDGNCVSCTWFSDGNIVPHPCPTVQAIEGAIND